MAQNTILKVFTIFLILLFTSTLCELMQSALHQVETWCVTKGQPKQSQANYIYQERLVQDLIPSKFFGKMNYLPDSVIHLDILVHPKIYFSTQLK